MLNKENLSWLGWMAFAIMLGLFVYNFAIREFQANQQLIWNRLLQVEAQLKEIKK